MKYSFLFLFLVVLNSVYAQTKNDTIKTEKLIIVKQYSPTLNDAFKVKSKPKVSDAILNTQKTVNYSIYSVPVASTFTPTKGKASNISQQYLPYTYNNYAKFGIGNYLNILGQFYGSVDLNQYQKLDIDLNHLSSSGGIEGVVLDDNFMDSSLDVTFRSDENNFDWNAGLGLLYKRYNWYGVDQSLIAEDGQLFEQELSGIDPLQSYFGVNANGQVEFADGIADQISIDIMSFSDAYSSSEFNAIVDADFDFPIANNALSLNFNLDFLSGGFDNFYNNTPTNLRGNLDYGFLATSLYPSYKFTTGDLSVDLGAKVTFLNNAEASESDVFIYPKVNSSYTISENLMLYAGIEGDLNKNTYQNIVQRNPFVSPTLEIIPTDNAFTGFIGFNGSLEKFGYNFKVFGRQENNALFFAENPVTSGGFSNFVPMEDYEFSNSFQVLYDDMFTLGVNLEATYSVLDDFDIGFSASYFNYSVDNLPAASNLPELELSLNAKYRIAEKWYLNSTLFFVGERESLGYITGPADGVDFSFQKVDGFVDFNLGLNYQLSERLGLFISGQNLLNNNYQYWRNFDVQGIQVMGGLSYQFDW